MALDDELVHVQRELQTLQQTHDEYVKSSCEYERELECEIERFESKAQASEASILVLQNANEQLATALADAQQQCEAAGRREQTAQDQMQELLRKIQQLEQTNDELETTVRIAHASIDELDHRLESVMEQNVFLMDEREDAAQRLSSFLVAEVFPMPTSPPDPAAFAGVSEKHAEHQHQQHHSHHHGHQKTTTRKGKKKKQARYPEVVESCLHITCQQCCKELSKKGTAPGFFERLRLRLFPSFRA